MHRNPDVINGIRFKDSNVTTQPIKQRSMTSRLINYLVLFSLAYVLVGCTNDKASIIPKIQCDAISSEVIVGSPVQISCIVRDGVNSQLSWTVEDAPDGFESITITETTSSLLFTPTLAGDFTLRLTAGNGEAPATADVSFTAIVNNAPQINCESFADPVPIDEPVSLSCTVTDDGIPADSVISLTWTLEQAPSGAAEVDLGDQPGASFTPEVAGGYLFKLTASDGNADASENIALTVIYTNDPPVITCDSSKLSVGVGQAVQVNCDVLDDGKPPGTGTTTLKWSATLEPEGVPNTFPDGSSINFIPDVAGNYTLQLTADDGELATSHDVDVWVTLASTINILPLGDSITQGNGGQQSYRYRLWKKLLDANIDFDYVGSITITYGSPPAVFPGYLGQEFDRDHEGRSGWTSNEIFAALPAWQQNYDADVVLLHLGTNDMFQGQSVASTIDELKAIIDELRNDNPAVTILLAKPIPSTVDSELPLLQASIPDIAIDKTTAQSKVIVVDLVSGFDATTGVDTYDGVHPNEDGEEKIAQKFSDAILSLF